MGRPAGRGRRGRPAKPTPLRVVSGERKPTTRPSGSKAKSSTTVKPPAWLKGELALAAWKRLGPDLEEAGLLAEEDAEAFADYCSAVADAAVAREHVDAEGHVIQVEGKPPRRNEWSRVLTEALGRKDRGAARFGFTPSDRASLAMGRGSRNGDDEGKSAARLLS